MTKIYDELTTSNIVSGVPDKDALLLADALLFSVYGWNPAKVSKMKISLIQRWVVYAKKRMAWGDAFKLRRLLEAKPKKVSIWNKLFQIKS